MLYITEMFCYILHYMLCYNYYRYVMLYITEMLYCPAVLPNIPASPHELKNKVIVKVCIVLCLLV